MILAEGASGVETWHVLVGFGAMVFFGFLLNIHARLGKYIRQQAGVSEATETKITPHPLTVKPVVRMATFDELEQVRAAVTKLDADIDKMGEKLDEGLKDIRTEGNESERRLQVEASKRASSLHQRMDKLSDKLSAADQRSELTHNAVTGLNDTLIQFMRDQAKQSKGS